MRPQLREAIIGDVAIVIVVIIGVVVLRPRALPLDGTPRLGSGGRFLAELARLPLGRLTLTRLTLTLTRLALAALALGLVLVPRSRASLGRAALRGVARLIAILLFPGWLCFACHVVASMLWAP
ncbi:hypothetical protein [Paracoccus sp. SJTW-4]|uniref:hypothetical protein n=1 Tax=Paracoccus sp. SJTW-4 TaxID=3078428 RepID=UPI0039E7B884